MLLSALIILICGAVIPEAVTTEEFDSELLLKVSFLQSC